LRAFKPREKTCRACGNRYMPVKLMQKVCGPLCAIQFAQSERAKRERKQAAQERAETRRRLDEMKGIPELIREADIAFCAYIRARDRLAGHPCISSGLPLDWSGNNVDAGHYRSRGAASHLRYDERNCHAQSKHENRYKGGNIVEYRKRLIERIGLADVEDLEADNETHKWTREELIEKKKYFIAKRKELEKNK